MRKTKRLTCKLIVSQHTSILFTVVADTSVLLLNLANGSFFICCESKFQQVQRISALSFCRTIAQRKLRSLIIEVINTCSIVYLYTQPVPYLPVAAQSFITIFISIHLISFNFLFVITDLLYSFDRTKNYTCMQF